MRSRACGKRFLQQSGAHVPLIMYFPPKWRHLAPVDPGTRLNHPVSFVDFAPIVLSIAGVEIPAHMPGRPFAGPRRATNELYMFRARGYQSWARLAGEGKLTPATSRF